MATSPSRVNFGAFSLDQKTGELRKNGSLIRLAPQPSRILVLLVSRSGDIVTREEIHRHIWGDDTFVDFDKGVNFCIRQIRTALRDDADQPTYIETLPRRGYRFIAPVEITPSSDDQSRAESQLVGKIAPSNGRRRQLRMAVLGTLAGVAAVVLVVIVLWPRSPSIDSVTMLPFRNLSQDPTEDEFAAGITYSVTNELAQISALRVISYRSAMTYKDTKKSLREIASELKVDAIVEGAIMRSGGHAHIEIQLVDTRLDRHLWARDFRVDQNNVIGLAGETVRQIAAAFRVKVTPYEEARLARSPTSNPSAYEAYLKGRYFWAKWTSSNWQWAAGYSQRAIELDPNYPDAYVGVADCYGLMASYGAVSARLFMGCDRKGASA